jgi:hypothetical protein
MPDLDEQTAIVDGLARYLEQFEYAPAKKLSVVNDPTNTRDFGKEEVQSPWIYIDFQDPSWSRIGPVLQRDSTEGVYSLYRTSEFNAIVQIMIGADNHDLRAKVLMAVRNALEPDIGETSQDEIKIALPRYFGGYDDLRCVLDRAQIDDSPELIQLGEFNARVDLRVEMPIYKLAMLAEGRPSFRLRMSDEEL